ncbi:MAG: transcription termination factor Rho, partial [Verrucomicrobiota bacterium]|nr:transcription termination factor Rho [Verrucomicrobiota bacterium]
MSTEEENIALPEEDHSTAAEATPKKRAAKKAAKKVMKKRITSNGAAAKYSGDTRSDTSTPSELASAKIESDIMLSSSSNGDEEVTFSKDIKVNQVEEKDLSDQPEQPSEPKVGHGNSGKGHKSNHNNGAKNQNQNQHPSDRQKGSGKFNKSNKNNNKRKRGKNNRWDKNKGKRELEEESPIEFGELLDWEVLGNREDILALAEDLKSGGGKPLDYVRIYNMLLPELREEVTALGVDTPNAPNRDQLINAITQYAAEKKAAIVTTGILEVLDEDEGGLIVYERDSYRVKALSAYVPQAFIKHYGLQRGHVVKAQLHPHREGESCPIVVRVESVMDKDPETLSQIVPFTERVP